MANPLFNAIMGGSDGFKQQGWQEQKNGQNAPKTTQMGMQDMMKQLQANPSAMIRQAGYNVPEQYTHDPQSAAMYLIQSGQVGGPMMRRIQPMLNMLMGKR